MTGLPPDRALTVWEPWASAIAHGGKRVENRVWRTSYRGRLWIHAAAASSHRAHLSELVEVNRKSSTATFIPGNLRYGQLVAVADLYAVCAPYQCGCVGDDRDWAEHGQFHFHLRNVRPLPDGPPIRGAQQLWRLADPPPVPELPEVAR